MFKKLFYLPIMLLSGINLVAQDDIYPAEAQKTPTAITNATIHVGNGNVIEQGTVVFEKGKITFVGTGANLPPGVNTINGTGMHVYPGLILPNTNLGIKEVGSGTRATNDYAELGDINPNVRSIVAYNTDSKIINTLRSNGILFAGITPEGGLISGTSSVVQLDAWNWEDAAYHADAGIHFNMPGLLNRPNPYAAFFGPSQGVDRTKTSLERIELVKDFFRKAKYYHQDAGPKDINLKYESVKGLYNKTQKLFIHCDLVKEMLIAIDFVNEFGFDVVIVGGVESYRIADLLKKHNISVILGEMHRLPTMVDDDIDQPFKTPAALQKAGVLYAIGDEDGQTRGRNLSFNAGTAVSYGLTKEEALTALTLNPAKILGIDKQSGSIEVGKDANIVISEGDILDMRNSIITHAFIQGRQIDLQNKHTQLRDRYKHKYEIE